MQQSDALYLFNEGRNFQAYRLLGAEAGASGTRFRVWAPNASQVLVLGDFNAWQGEAHVMHALSGSGIWELEVPEAVPGSLYRFAITNRETGVVHIKSDPYARGFEKRPGSAAYVVEPSRHVWADDAWLQARAAWDWQQAPVNIYEVHAGSWMRHLDGTPYLWRELAERLIPYAVEQGYTHLELLPITEHPLDESWGYQTTGYFAPPRASARPTTCAPSSTPAIRPGIGVILDWVPGHFPADDWALARYDGTALYEHEDPRRPAPDWGTHVFNYGRHEVRSFLLSSPTGWLRVPFRRPARRCRGLDALPRLLAQARRMVARTATADAKTSTPSISCAQLNAMVHAEFPGALTIAEESTAWPMVSRPTWLGGLGFLDEVEHGLDERHLRLHRAATRYPPPHHHELTFGQLYAYSENFVLPLSHDEVVHGKAR
jgi:1,4-alpha-glucan branching enzyme